MIGHRPEPGHGQIEGGEEGSGAADARERGDGSRDGVRAAVAADPGARAAGRGVASGGEAPSAVVDQDEVGARGDGIDLAALAGGKQAARPRVARVEDRDLEVAVQAVVARAIVEDHDGRARIAQQLRCADAIGSRGDEGARAGEQRALVAEVVEAIRDEGAAIGTRASVAAHRHAHAVAVGREDREQGPDGGGAAGAAGVGRSDGDDGDADGGDRCESGVEGCGSDRRPRADGGGDGLEPGAGGGLGGRLARCGGDAAGDAGCGAVGCRRAGGLLGGGLLGGGAVEAGEGLGLRVPWRGGGWWRRSVGRLLWRTRARGRWCGGLRSRGRRRRRLRGARGRRCGGRRCRR